MVTDHCCCSLGYQHIITLPPASLGLCMPVFFFFFFLNEAGSYCVVLHSHKTNSQHSFCLSFPRNGITGMHLSLCLSPFLLLPVVFLSFIFYVCGCFACMYFCIPCACLLFVDSRRGNQMPGTGIINSGELPCGCWDSNKVLWKETKF